VELAVAYSGAPLPIMLNEGEANSASVVKLEWLRPCLCGTNAHTT